MGFGVGPFLRRALVVSQQNQSSNIIGIGSQQPVGCVYHLGLIPRLLVSPHQHFQRVLFHHAVGILRQEGFHAADFGSGVRLLDRSHVSVLLRRILDFFLLGLGLGRRLR